MITEFNSGNHTYTIDSEKVTCTCPDFKYRRSTRLLDNPDRLCKHLTAYYNEHPEMRPAVLKGFDPQLGQKDLDGKIRYPRSLFDIYVDDLRMTLESFKEIEKFEFCGSYRRRAARVSDLDILIVLHEGETIERFNQYCKEALKYEVLWEGPLKIAYMIDKIIHVDIKVVPAESWPFAVCHFTGSKNENISLRRKAIQMGMKLNEYGLFNQNGEPIQGITTEKDIYGALQLPYKQPWER